MVKLTLVASAQKAVDGGDAIKCAARLLLHHSLSPPPAESEFMVSWMSHDSRALGNVPRVAFTIKLDARLIQVSAPPAGPSVHELIQLGWMLPVPNPAPKVTPE